MRLIFIAYCFLFSNVLAAQSPPGANCSHTLSGQVIDEHDKSLLEFATVYLKEIDKGTVADAMGNFKIENICNGVYTAKVSHVGCEDLEIPIQVKGNTKIDFYLEHHAHELGILKITGKKIEKTSTQPADVITGKELEETNGKSLGESLKKIQGVTTLQTGSNISKPVIHGLHSNRILILNNGIRQEGQQWGREHAPEIDPFIAGKLTVVKGAGSLRYGSDAIGGVVLVEPKALRDSAGIGGELNLVGFSNGRQGIASGMLEGNFKKLSPLSWRLQGTVKKAGNVNAPSYYLKNTGLEELDFSASAGYKKESYGTKLFYSRFNTNLGIFSGAHIGNLTDLKRAFEAHEPLEKSDFSYEIERPFQHVEHELFKFKSYINTGGAGKLNFIYARQYNLRNEYDKHRPRNDSVAALNIPELHLEITTHTGELVWEHKAVKNIQGSIGVNGMYQQNTYEGRFFIPNFKNYTGGAFLIERWKKNKLEIEGGIRYDRKNMQVFMRENNELISPEYNFANVSGSLGSVYKFNERFFVAVNAGTAWRPPAVNELFSNGLHHGAAAIETGDRNLKIEKAYDIISSISYSGKQRLNAEAAFYYKIIDDYIFLSPAQEPVLTIRGAFPAFYFSQADVTFKGTDLRLDYKLTEHLTFETKASIVRAFNKTINDHLVLIPPDRFENELTYTFNETGLFKSSYISLSTLNVSEQTRIPPNSDFVPPPDGYMLFNIESGTDLFFGKQKLIIGFGIQNLLNTSYRDYMDRFRYYTNAMGRNFTIRIKIPFEL